MEHFNKLSPAQAERLAILSEECGELIQAIGKILRHGYNSHNPNDMDHLGNRHDLERECADVMAAMEMLARDGDVDREKVSNLMPVKLRSVQKYMHHN